MRTILKALAWLIGVVVVCLVALVIFVFTLDPNLIKPKLEAMAKDQGYRLDIQGDIGWKFYPSLGVSVGRAVVKEIDSGEQPLAFDSAAVQVALLPLLRRELKIEGISIDTAELVYRAKAASPQQAQQDQKTASGDNIDIQNISLKNSSFTFIPQSGNTIELSALNAQLTGVNLVGDGFPFSLDGVVTLAELPPLKFDLKGDLGFNLANQKLSIAALEGGADTANASGKNRVGWSIAGDLSMAPSLDGKLETSIQAYELRALLGELGIAMPPMQGAQALSKLQLDGVLTLSDQFIEFKSSRFAFDGTTGEFVFSSESPAKGSKAPAKIITKISGDRLIASAYLPPPEDKPEKAPANPPVKQVDAKPVEVPFELLRDKDLAITLGLQELRYNHVDIRNFESNLLIRNAKARQTLAFKVADGDVKGNLEVEALGNKGKGGNVKSEIAFTALKVDTLLEQLGQPPELAGPITGTFNMMTNGATDIALKNNLKAELRAESAALRLNSINIEQRFCEAVALLHGRTAAPDGSQEWKQYSDLSPLALRAKIVDNRLILEELDAKVQELSAQSTGELDLDTGEFRFPLDVRMSDFSAGLDGCIAIDEIWRKSAIPLRCKGNIANIGAKTCLPDGPRITQQIKDRAKEVAKKEVDKAKDKAEDKLKEVIDKNIDPEKVDSIKGALKGIFGR